MNRAALHRSDSSRRMTIGKPIAAAFFVDNCLRAVEI